MKTKSGSISTMPLNHLEVEGHDNQIHEVSALEELKKERQQQQPHEMYANPQDYRDEPSELDASSRR
jgi:hypothetical protein